MQGGQAYGQTRVHVGQRRFKQEVCGCFDNTKLCLPSFCLFTPCVTAQTMGRVKFFPCGGNFVTSRNVLVAAFVIMSITYNIDSFVRLPNQGTYYLLQCLFLASFVTFFYMLNSLRSFIRLKYNIQGDGCLDCLVNWFCTPCSVAQLAAEVDVEDPCSLREPSEYIAPAGSAGTVVYAVSPQVVYIPERQQQQPVIYAQQPVIYAQQPVIYAQAVPAAEVGRSKMSV